MTPTVNWVRIPARKALKHVKSLEIQHFVRFSTYLDQRFLITCPDFRSVVGHSTSAKSGVALNRPIGK